MLFAKTIAWLQLVQSLLFSLQLMAALLLLFLIIKYIGKLFSLAMYYVAVLLQTIGLIGFFSSFFLYNGVAQFASFYNDDYKNTISQYVSIVYSVVTLWFLVRLLFGYKKLHTQKHVTSTVSLYWQSFVNSVVDEYLPNKKIIIKWVNNAATVFTYGFIKPVIILPIACINNLSEQEFKAIVLHEIAHIKYGHFVLNIWVELVSALLWFNPFNYWLHKEINFYREASADAFVLQQTKNQFTYANGLYKLALKVVTPKNSISLPAVHSKNELLKRIQFIAKQKPSFTFSYKSVGIGILAFVFLVGINKASTKLQKQEEVQKPIVLKNQEKVEVKTFVQTDKKQESVAIVSKTKIKLNTKKVQQPKPQSIYLLEDKQEFAQGLKYLSELAIENPILQSIINNNPTITPVALKEEDNKQMVRRFIIPPTRTKGAVLVKITVEERKNAKPKVTIELEEQPLIEAS